MDDTSLIPAVVAMVSRRQARLELEIGDRSVVGMRATPALLGACAAATKEPPTPSGDMVILSPSVAVRILALTMMPVWRKGWPNRLISIGEISRVMQRLGVIVVGSPIWMVWPVAQPETSAASMTLRSVALT